MSRPRALESRVFDSAIALDVNAVVDGWFGYAWYRRDTKDGVRWQYGNGTLTEAELLAAGPVTEICDSQQAHEVSVFRTVPTRSKPEGGLWRWRCSCGAPEDNWDNFTAGWSTRSLAEADAAVHCDAQRGGMS